MEITCVNLVMIPSHPNTFVINTLERTFRRKALIISMDSEKEANEWILLICVETAKVRQPHKRKAPSKDSIWVTNVSGDVFYCSPSTSEDFALDTMFWLQVGGHMKKVTAGVEGIVWGIGFDGKAYAYSGGEGGGILQGHEFSQDEIYEQEDSEEVFIYENQRWNPIQGFSERFVSNFLCTSFIHKNSLEIVRIRTGWLFPNSENVDFIVIVVKNKPLFCKTWVRNQRWSRTRAKLCPLLFLNLKEWNRMNSETSSSIFGDVNMPVNCTLH